MSYDYESLQTKGDEQEANLRYYRDYSNISDVLPEIKSGEKDNVSVTLAQWIRQKAYGRDVRESIAQFVEWISVLTNKHFDFSKTVGDKQVQLEERFERQVGQLTDEAEVIDARGKYNVLGKRLETMELGTENIKTLKLLPALPGIIVSTKYFGIVGDKGGATYKIIENTGSKGDGYSLIDLENGLQAKLVITDRVNVRLFGAVGDGKTDDTAALKRAIAFVEAAKNDDGMARFDHGFTIYLPNGTYLVSGTLKISKSNISIAGESASSTIIYAPNATFDIVVFDGSTKAVYGAGIKDIKIYCPGNATAGTALRFVNVINSINGNVEIAGAFEGIEVDSGGKVYINQFLVTQTNRMPGTIVGYQIKILGTHGIPGDIHFSDIQVTPNYQTQDYVMLIRASDGLYFDNFHIHGGVLIEPRNTGFETTLASIFFNNTYFDNAAKNNLYIKGTADAYRNIFLSNCYVRGAINGVVFGTQSEVQMFQMRGGKIGGQLNHGILMENANVADSVISQVAFENNNRNAIVDGTDILVRGKGIIITDTVHYNDNERKGYLINLGGASENCIVNNVIGVRARVLNNSANYKVPNNGTGNTVGVVK